VFEIYFLNLLLNADTLLFIGSIDSWHSEGIWLSSTLCCAFLQKYFEIDDSFEENKRQHSEKITSLESIIRLFEVKMKNAQDQSKYWILQ